MESNNRNVWIIVGIIVVLLCCCVVAAGAGAVAFFTSAPVFEGEGMGRVTERSEQVYPAGQAPTLEVDNFAGDILVRSGESGRIRIVVTKRATNSSRLNRIDVDLDQREDGLRIRTSRPGSLMDNLSVEIEVFVPADARLALETGAGNIEVDGVQGEIAARTGAGNVRLQGAGGPVALNTGAGDVNYEGQPRGECIFDTGAGNITLHLPADVDAEVELDTGIGNISLGGFDVVGDTSGTDVQGTLGAGREATIVADTGVGDITLMRR